MIVMCLAYRSGVGLCLCVMCLRRVRQVVGLSSLWSGMRVFCRRIACLRCVLMSCRLRAGFDAMRVSRRRRRFGAGFPLERLVMHVARRFATALWGRLPMFRCGLRTGLRGSAFCV